MSVGAPAMLSAPNFFLSRRSILPRAVGEDLTSPTRGTGAPKVPVFPSPSLLLYPPPPQHLHALYLPLTCTSTRTTALGGVCPAPRPHGMGVSVVRLSRTSPMSGTPWAPKALFGFGKTSPKPKAHPHPKKDCKREGGGLGGSKVGWVDGQHDAAHDVPISEYICDRNRIDLDLFRGYKPSAKFIASYVHMSIVPGFYEDEYMTHGGPLVNEMPTDAETASLVVSNSDKPDDLKRIVDALKEGYHPFREVFVHPPNNDTSETVALSADIRGAADDTTLKHIKADGRGPFRRVQCPPVTPRRMTHTNVYFTARQPTRIPRSPEGKPILHYIGDDYCRRFGVCRASKLRAGLFAASWDVPALPGHLRRSDMRFHTAPDRRVLHRPERPGPGGRAGPHPGAHPR